MYYDIYCKNMELTDATRVVVHEKLGSLEQLMHDYPPESAMGKVVLSRLPMADEYYDVRVALELPGDRLYARAKAETLESALVRVSGELETQLQHLLSNRRNESHWKRMRRRPETVRHSVPVDVDELGRIDEEIRQRTEGHRAAWGVGRSTLHEPPPDTGRPSSV